LGVCERSLSILTFGYLKHMAIDPHFLVHYSPFHLLLNFLIIFALTKIKNSVYAFIQKSDFQNQRKDIHAPS